MTQSIPAVLADRYALRSLIGRGGAGAVWLADDLHLRRSVAVKQIVLSDVGSTRSRSRAMREAQAVAKLRVPGVVQVYDVLDDGAQISLIMELIDAPSLSRVVRRTGPLPTSAAAQVGLSLVRTLRSVHAAGVVHRDIKPSNILISAAGAHITDFGIALLSNDPALTAAGSVLGTPVYMAPEQARGERAGPWTDLYGIGATIYYAIEGRPPFDDRGAAETTRAVREQPHRTGTKLAELAPTIDALLAKDPHQRPDAVAVMAAFSTATGTTGRTLTIDLPPAAATGHVTDEPHAAHDADTADPAHNADTADPAHNADVAGADADAGAGAGAGDAETTGGAATARGTGIPTAGGASTARAASAASENANTAGRATSRDPAAGDSTNPARAEALPPVPSDDDSRQWRRAVIWGVGLLLLLALALLLLYLAVRDHPGAVAAAPLALRAPIIATYLIEEQ